MSFHFPPASFSPKRSSTIVCSLSRKLADSIVQKLFSTSSSRSPVDHILVRSQNIRQQKLISVPVHIQRFINGHLQSRLAVPSQIHQDLIFNAAGGIGCQLDTFCSGLKVLMALISPMVPMEIRSSTPTPVLSNFFAMYTTSRRLCSISSAFASWLLRRFPAGRSLCASSSEASGAGSTSLPPI